MVCAIMVIVLMVMLIPRIPMLGKTFEQLSPTGLRVLEKNYKTYKDSFGRNKNISLREYLPMFKKTIITMLVMVGIFVILGILEVVFLWIPMLSGAPGPGGS